MNYTQQQDLIAGMPKDEVETHISELIKRIRVIFISISLTSLFVGLIPIKFIEGKIIFDDYSPAIFFVLEELLKWATALAESQGGGNFTFTLGAPYTIIVVSIELAVLLGIILNIPLISYEIYAYIRPALYDEEADFAIKLSLSFGLLFSLGIFIGWLLVPIMVQSLFSLTTVLDYGRIVNFVPLESFVSFIFFALLGTGVLFTFPLWLISASMVGLITSEDLIVRRKEIVIGLLALTAVVTPDPTPLSMIFLSLPLIVLFEVTVVVIMRYEERKSVSGVGFSTFKRISQAWEADS
ncbi:MAG: twin-arginine translocase subunit TatC [Candidatus Hodarchaeales archaeon]